MAKLWGGRFSKSTDTLVDDFNSSIRFDARMYAQDIKGICTCHYYPCIYHPDWMRQLNHRRI